MASFAELTENNVVLRVVKIDNDSMLDAFGNESEGMGIAECNKILGTSRWVQCSASNAFRKRFAYIGSTYDKTRDVFIDKKIHSNWVLDEETLSYIPPVPYPDDGACHRWDQENNKWIYLGSTNPTA